MNKVFIIIILIFSFSAWSREFDCRKVIIKSESTFKSESLELCFLKDPSYFISKTCQDFKCGLVKRLEKIKIAKNDQNRPAISMCQALEGASETVLIGGKSTKRCIFPGDHTSISFNLMESWNGKTFSGPSTPMKF